MISYLITFYTFVIFAVGLIVTYDVAKKELEKTPEPPIKTHNLTESDLAKLNKVHPDLKKVILLAATRIDIDFKVGEGLRSLEKQKEYVRKGVSQTLRSRHLTGHAVDLWILDDRGRVIWRPKSVYEPLWAEIKKAADELGVCVEWGGYWRTLYDPYHIQLCRSKYPA